MAALVREKFTNCERNSGITASHLNANYAARIVAGGDLENGKPEVNLSGSADNANEVYGEIKGALNSDTVTVQTGGILYLRTTGLRISMPLSGKAFKLFRQQMLRTQVHSVSGLVGFSAA